MIRNLILIIVIFIISSCSNNGTVTNPITGEKPTPGLFSKDSKKGISLSDILSPKDSDGNNINVNGFLWRASLEVLSIAPLLSTDALGGTIITDWYIYKNIKNQRIKITAFIKTSELRSDGIEVKVHIQNKEDGVWSDVMTNNKLKTQIEDKILNEARILRINSLK
jgi:ribosome-associated protein YbcJ (S4-like RNA binding protein)